MKKLLILIIGLLVSSSQIVRASGEPRPEDLAVRVLPWAGLHPVMRTYSIDAGDHGDSDDDVIMEDDETPMDLE